MESVSYYDESVTEKKSGFLKRLLARGTSTRISRIVLLLVLVAVVGSVYVIGSNINSYLETPRVKNASAAQFKNLYDDPNTPIYIVDLRNQQEYKDGHIPGSYNVPLDVARAQSVYFPKDTTIVLYGSGDVQETQVLGDKLIEEGVTSVYVIKEGYEEWKKKGYETEQTPELIEVE